MDVFGQLWQAEVNKFHLLHPSKADGAHESLQKQVRVFIASVQRTDQNTVENLKSFQATGKLEKFDKRIEILQVVDDGGSFCSIELKFPRSGKVAYLSAPIYIRPTARWPPEPLWSAGF